MRRHAVTMSCVCQGMSCAASMKESSLLFCLCWRTSLVLSSCPPAQGCDVQASFLKEPPYLFSIILEGAEHHGKRGRGRWYSLLWILVGHKQHHAFPPLVCSLTWVPCKPRTSRLLRGDPAQDPESLLEQKCLTEQLIPISISLRLCKGNKKPQIPAAHTSRKLVSRAPLGGVRGHQSSSNTSAQSGVMGLFPAGSFLFLQHVQIKGFNAAGASCF